MPKITCMDTLSTFGLPPLSCYLSAWFLYLPLLLSFSAHQWINQLIHLPISQNLACSDTGNLLEELWLSDSLAGENKFPCSVLLKILETGTFLHFSGTGITNSSHLLLSVFHQAPNAPDQSRGCSPHGAGNQLWARLYSVRGDTLLLMAAFSLKSVCCFH